MMNRERFQKNKIDLKFEKRTTVTLKLNPTAKIPKQTNAHSPRHHVVYSLGYKKVDSDLHISFCPDNRLQVLLFLGKPHGNELCQLRSIDHRRIHILRFRHCPMTLMPPLRSIWLRRQRSLRRLFRSGQLRRFRS